jgi:hypothetical protein
VGDFAHAVSSADLAAILVIALGLIALGSRLFPDLETPEAPRGIVSLELAWNQARARAIVSSWRRRDQLASARRSVYLDIPFIALYVVALMAFAVLLARAGAAAELWSDGAAKWIAAGLAGAAGAAGVLDLVEDLGLWLLLRRKFWLAAPTSVVSLLKWLLLAVASVVGPAVALVAWSRTRERYLAFLATVPLLLLVVWFWRQRAIDPLTAPALLLDRAFQILTPALIVTSVLFLVGRRRLALYSITFTAAIGLMLGLSVTVSALVRPPADGRALALAVVSLLSAGALVARYASRIPELRSVPARAAAVALAAAIPLLQFWNGAAFLPARTEATLKQDLDVKVEGLSDGNFESTVHYEAANPTNARVLVIVTRLTLCWWRPGKTPNLDDRVMLRSRNCAAYRPLLANSWISPESSVKSAHSYLIPRGRPRVTIVAKVAFARGDRLRTTDETQRRARLGSCRDVEAVRLEEESRIKSLAQQSKYLVYADRNGDRGLNYYFESGSAIGCPPHHPANLEEYFGTTEQRQVLDVWLAPPRPPR